MNTKTVNGKLVACSVVVIMVVGVGIAIWARYTGGTRSLRSMQPSDAAPIDTDSKLDETSATTTPESKNAQ